MSREEDFALFAEFMPLVEAELDRLGVSRQDQRWIHAGTTERPTRARAEAWLADLRALPSGLGVVSYCKYLGFDYAEWKQKLALPSDAV